MSESSSRGQLPPTRIHLGPVPKSELKAMMSQTQSQRKEKFVLVGGPGVTQESILRSRIAELEAQVENLNAQLREAGHSNAQQLAACDCAALLDTAETHEENKTVTRGNPAWSPAFDSVMRRTAECIKLRREVEVLRRFGNKDCTAMADEELAKR